MIRLFNLIISLIIAVSSFPQARPDITKKAQTIHVFVALCDNKYQGIVPVPVKIGNGQDPNNNLYWGCGYGIKTFFKKSTEWKLIKTLKLDSVRLERLIFRHHSKNIFLIADAYDGRYIKKAIEDHLNSASGKIKETITINNETIGIYGHAGLLAYIGHDGLMDFELNESFNNVDGKTRDCIILACYSKNYFSKHIKQTGAQPLIWTTGLMCPEAYTLHSALNGYINNETPAQIRTGVAKTYSQYQKCSEKAARGLLVCGW